MDIATMDIFEFLKENNFRVCLTVYKTGTMYLGIVDSDGNSLQYCKSGMLRDISLTTSISTMQRDLGWLAYLLEENELTFYKESFIKCPKNLTAPKDIMQEIVLDLR